MSDNSTMKIRVEIAEKPFSLTIKKDEEEIVRRAAKSIKDQINALRRKHDATLVEYLSMAALLISIENENNKEKLFFSKELRDIDAMIEDLNQYLGVDVKDEFSRARYTEPTPEEL